MVSSDASDEDFVLLDYRPRDIRTHRSTVRVSGATKKSDCAIFITVFRRTENMEYNVKKIGVTNESPRLATNPEKLHDDHDGAHDEA